jgi:SAM-dependent methyltransferase
MLLKTVRPIASQCRGANMSLKSISKRLVRNLAMRTGLFEDDIFRRYPYMFTPRQLQFLTDCLLKIRDVRGCIVEAGCASGRTTVYLNRFMAEENLNRDYVAIDTFAGFLPEHSQFEISSRGKRPQIAAEFSDNSQTWFDHSMRLEGIVNVQSIAADVTKFDFHSLGEIAFALVDVDLYIPIKTALPKIYECMAPGGIIVVDDCAPGGDWDGALQAFQEFCNDTETRMEIACGKLGVFRKDASQTSLACVTVV